MSGRELRQLHVCILYAVDVLYVSRQVGFVFMAMKEVYVMALGRGVFGDKIRVPHVIRLWDDSSKSILASASIPSTAAPSPLGYVKADSSVPVPLHPGRAYRLTVQETSGSGDLWPDSSAGSASAGVAMIGVDASVIQITGDCSASGDVGAFPSTQTSNSSTWPRGTRTMGLPTFFFQVR